MPTWQDCDVIDSVIVILSPLHQLTDLLSSDKRVTCSVIKPLIKHIFESILSDKEEDTTLTQEMKSVIKQDLQNRYSGRETSTFLDLCSFLDPRFKGQYSNEENEFSETLYEEMKLFRTSDNQSSMSVNSDTEEPLLKRGKLSQVFGQINIGTPQTTLSVEERAKQELITYMQLPVPDIDDNPLKWWKFEESRLPTLSKVARKYLCVCATSVESERTFSTGGNIVTKKRSSLKPNKVNQLIFLAKNLK